MTTPRVAKAPTPVQLLRQLQHTKVQFGAGAGALMLKLLDAASRVQFRSASALIQFHELLLFIRVYPQNAEVKRKADALLANFCTRVAVLRGKDSELFDEEGAAGMA